MMLGWASAYPNFFDFGGENLWKSVDNIRLIVYNNRCKGEMEIPGTNEEDMENEKGTYKRD